MTVLVVGSTGQLARHLQELLPAAIFWSRADADLSQPAELEQKALGAAPSAIVNAAAYTAVDRAESEPGLAWRVNAEAPAALARAAAAMDIPLVQISTDYVFDGRSDRPYREADLVGPLSVYGATKLGGELAVRAICPKHWILRTSWVFSEFGANFVKTMLRLAKERDELKVVADQRGRPSYAGDLARLSVGLLESSVMGKSSVPFGTYHAVSGPSVSWHEFASKIIGRAYELGLIPRRPVVHGIPTSAYPTAAKRPANSVLQPSEALDKIAWRDWEAGLETVLSKLT